MSSVVSRTFSHSFLLIESRTLNGVSGTWFCFVLCTKKGVKQMKDVIYSFNNIPGTFTRHQTQC